jgi:hypothetical protein
MRTNTAANASSTQINLAVNTVAKDIACRVTYISLSNALVHTAAN